MKSNASNQTVNRERESPTPAIPLRTLVGRLLGLAWRYRVPSLLVTCWHTLLVALSVTGLGLSGLGIDVVRFHLDPQTLPPRWPLGWQPPAGWSPLQTLALIAGGMVVLALLHAGLKYWAAVATADLAQRILIRLRTDVYDKLQRLSFHFFDGAENSSLINRAAGDVQAVRTFVDGVIVKFLTVILSVVVYLAYMVSVDAWLTLACVATFPVLAWASVLFSRHVQPEYRLNSQLVDRLILKLSENVQGVHVVKGFAREGEEIREFRQRNQAVRDQKWRIFRWISLYQPASGLLPHLNMAVLLSLGGYLVIQGRLPLGTGLFVMATLLNEFTNQISQITSIANTVQSSIGGAERVFEILDTPIEIQSPPRPVRLQRARGRIQLEHVSFGYPGGPPVLHDLCLTIEPGECVGIVGDMGAGKSSLLSLLPRFYDPRSGWVRVDGHCVTDLHLDDLRRQVGIVFQESFLFSNTVEANIAFGNPQATTEQIERAARAAAADCFIAQLPDQYQTVIGEYGANLSGGQRQRLAIARALLLDPPILLLDDATAAVDAHTEHEIQEAIQDAMQGRTTLMVSHRVSTLCRADRIFVLQHGRLIQSGSHQQLVRRPGYYRQLVEMQFADAVA